MKTRIVRIGNSQGIRIPRPILEESGLSGEVEVRVENNKLVITGVRKPREGWEKAFREMARRGDDVLLDASSGISLQGDEDEWQWQWQ